MDNRTKSEMEFFNSRYRPTLERVEPVPMRPVTSPEVVGSRDEAGAMYYILGDLGGSQVLDLGCGIGIQSCQLMSLGAEVWALDVSLVAMKVVRTRAEVSRLAARLRPVVGSAEELPFPCDLFDVVFGCGVLHHIDVSRVAKEVKRVLKPSGMGLFSEPLGINPVLQFARERLPHLGPKESPGGRALIRADLQTLRRTFASVEIRGTHLLSSLMKTGRLTSLWPWLVEIDKFLIHNWPSLNEWCSGALVILRK